MAKRKLTEEPTDVTPLPETPVEPSYEAIFASGDTVEMNVEDLCIPLYLEPFYEARITIIYQGKRVMSMARNHGIFRLWLEDGEEIAATSAQVLVVTRGTVSQEIEGTLSFTGLVFNEPDADGDVVYDESLNGVPIDDSALFPEDEFSDGDAAG